LRGQEPKWDEAFRSLSCHGAEWRQIAFPETNAIACNLAPVAAGPLEPSGGMRILPGGRGQMNVLFGRTENGSFHSIAFVAGYGFTVFRFDAASDQWTKIGEAEVPALRLGISTPFAVTAKGKALHVRLAE